MLTIKDASIADIPLIRELTMQVWPATYLPIIGAEQVAYMLGLFYAPEQLRKQMQESQHRFMIGYSDEQPVTFASTSETEPGIFKLHKLYILPGSQGKGIGQFMIRHILKDLKSRNAAALRLNVNRYNYSAIAFYKKSGFHHFADEDIDIGNGYFMNDHILEIDL